MTVVLQFSCNFDVIVGGSKYHFYIPSSCQKLVPIFNGITQFIGIDYYDLRIELSMPLFLSLQKLLYLSLFHIESECGRSEQLNIYPSRWVCHS